MYVEEKVEETAPISTYLAHRERADVLYNEPILVFSWQMFFWHQLGYLIGLLND